jgi:hypothetical protein
MDDRYVFSALAGLLAIAIVIAIAAKARHSM